MATPRKAAGATAPAPARRTPARDTSPLPEVKDLEGLWLTYREPPAEYVAKLTKTWNDKQGNRQSLTLDYVGHADVTDILLRADPEWNWEPMGYTPEGMPALIVNSSGYPIGLWIKLTILGHTRIGYGSVAQGKDEAVKELIGDALRNASMRFGIALRLWSKAEWAEIEAHQGDTHDGPRPANGTAPVAAPAPTPAASTPPEPATPAAAESAPAPAPTAASTPAPEPDPAFDNSDDAIAKELIGRCRDAISHLDNAGSRAYAKYRREMKLPARPDDMTYDQAENLFVFLEQYMAAAT